MALADTLAARTKEATLVESLPGGWVRCVACGHRCRIPAGHEGVCKVRFNRDGRLFAPWGYTAGIQCDPIEKKPFFHAWPGALAFSFGMLGCDMHCGYCQNWLTSQTLRDPRASVEPRGTSPDELVNLAVGLNARLVVSTYNEPLITTEWGVDVFRAAREAGLATAYVSNGNGTPEAIDYLAPWVDLYKIDLKSFSDREYRKLGARLDPILETIADIHRRGIWLEIVTLLVPGLNDSDEELDQLTGFLAGVSPDIPWHVTAFHQDYKMIDRGGTTPQMLCRAAGIGRRAGLRYVYAGNVPGGVGDWEDTRCPGCDTILIERAGFRVEGYFLRPDGTCPTCATAIPGRWAARFEGQRTSFPLRVLRR